MTSNALISSADRVRIGIDLGGTKTELVALDHDGSERLRMRVATPSNDYTNIIETIASLVEVAESKLHTDVLTPVGVGTPGTLCSITKTMKNANTTCLIGRPFDHDLSARLGRPIRVANDANCFTLSEAIDGSGRGANIVFGVIIGTGVGGGIVINQRLISGHHHIAGEWGHNPLPPATWSKAEQTVATESARPCYCGRRGCIETLLSGPGVLADHANQTGVSLRGVDELARRASHGDASCEATLARFYERLGRSLATVVNLLDPDVVVLGGGLSNLPGVCQQAAKHMKSYVFDPAPETQIRVAQHGDSSGVRGAARLWPLPA